jgi:uncharacterized protein (DUF1800 family)
VTTNASIAANRFGLGTRPDELLAIGADPQGWLIQQIAAASANPVQITKLPSSAQVVETLIAARDQRRTARAEKDARKVAGLGRQLRPIYLAQVGVRYDVATQSTHSFRERLVHFWTNHFAVSADKVQVTGLAATLENEAIRPHVCGTFEDLLLAAEAHPAMILYLDNQASIGPNSQLAERAGRRARSNRPKLGLNENLAREILELHTLGVDGGYSQADVTTFAATLTGWSIGGGFGPVREGTPGVFEFRENAHEPGAKTILGKRYTESGLAQSRAVLRDLARHPATAKHIATKLARHFIADSPPQASVDRLTRVFLKKDGDLAALYRELVTMPEAWNETPVKFKTPHEFVISAMRMFDFTPVPQVLFGTFQNLGQRPFIPGSPAGWPDSAEHWDGPDALLKRIEWASTFSQRFAARTQPLDLAHQTLGSTLNAYTGTAIARAASAAQGLTLLLASPEFQRR